MQTQQRKPIRAGIRSQMFASTTHQTQGHTCQPDRGAVVTVVCDGTGVGSYVFVSLHVLLVTFRLSLLFLLQTSVIKKTSRLNFIKLFEEVESAQGRRALPLISQSSDFCRRGDTSSRNLKKSSWFSFKLLIQYLFCG